MERAIEGSGGVEYHMKTAFYARWVRSDGCPGN
jgi:hypothetical protein